MVRLVFFFRVFSAALSVLVKLSLGLEELTQKKTYYIQNTAKV